MLRVFRLLRISLPFEPMALTTLDSLHSRLGSLKLQSENGRVPKAHRITLQEGEVAIHHHLHDSPNWFQSSLPFFISPKHDGVRMITFPPELSSTHNHHIDRLGQAKTSKSASKSTDKPYIAETTCFSRYGRPIHGMFWIEHELALLKALCRDPMLVLDGELYIHQSVPDKGKSDDTDESVSPADESFPKRGSLKAQGEGKDGVSLIDECKSTEVEPASASLTRESDSFKTGFLAVSALVHRLRGSGKNSPSRSGISSIGSISDRLAEVLQYVNTLPRYFLFDVVSFSPPQESAGVHSGRESEQKFQGRRSRKGAAVRQISSELERILQLTMKAHHVTDLEMLRCVPNLTPFSQRLRTLYFLTDLLSRGVNSPTLQKAFSLTNLTSDEGTASSCCKTAKKSKARKKRTDGGDPRSSGEVPYIQMIPYRLVRSLEEAEHSLLPSYVAQGYEGAVIRTPTNLYEFREKRKDVLRRFVEPLMLQRPMNCKRVQLRRRAPSVDVDSPPLKRTASVHQDIVNTQRMVLLRTYAGDEVNKGCRRTTGRSDRLEKGIHEDRGDDESAAANATENDIVASSKQIAQRALEHSKNLPRRCETCVKLLPFRDKEYAVLRPLLKVPSTNPRARPLVAIPIKEVESRKGREGIPIKRNTCKKQKDASKNESPQRDCTDDEGMVVFYGLQCLAENGRVFNVSIPKMSAEKQRALLQHLLEVSQKRQGKKTLTGMYVTVKFASLTEHGVPRFGTVKAIRGGKGWFL
ncbi:unnamed protein product [Phytomonas sp. EM1]|nr:unnamed protein product [Phytomonas sp. EM1]|eukprot:CCW60425.1 unnamed protein product [Phytomonas sp. isolate EM1]